MEREREIAKQELAAGHKDRALVALRRRKYQQGLLVRTDSQLEALEQLVCVPAISPQHGSTSSDFLLTCGPVVAFLE